MSFHTVNGTTIIHGKSYVKPNQIISSSDLEKKYGSGKNIPATRVNGAQIEELANTKETLAYPTIPREISSAIQTKRKEMNLTKQTDLQQRCQVPIDIIKMNNLEYVKMLLQPYKRTNVA